MIPKAEEPKITVKSGLHEDSIETHPAYAQISASRISGERNLYGSDFSHHNFVSIRVYASELHRGLSRDWAFAREQYIEVSLSEAQWASFVSTLNSGGGIQCTLNHRNGAHIPAIASKVDRQKQFGAEHRKSMQESIDRLTEFQAKLDELKLSEKQKRALKSDIEMAKSGISGSLDFVSKQFGEHMEEVTEHAKIEVNAYIQSRIERAGLEALQNESSTPLITFKE